MLLRNAAICNLYLFLSCDKNLYSCFIMCSPQVKGTLKILHFEFKVTTQVQHQTYGVDALNEISCMCWFIRFKSGKFSPENEACEGHSNDSIWLLLLQQILPLRLGELLRNLILDMQQSYLNFKSIELLPCLENGSHKTTLNIMVNNVLIATSPL